MSTGPSTDEMRLVYLGLSQECDYISKDASLGAWVILYMGPTRCCFSKWMSEKENNAMVQKLVLLLYRICSVCKEVVFKFANEIKDLLCNCF